MRTNGCEHSETIAPKRMWKPPYIDFLAFLAVLFYQYAHEHTGNVQGGWGVGEAIKLQ